MANKHGKPLTESNGGQSQETVHREQWRTITGNPSLRAMEDNHRKLLTESNGEQSQETPH